MKNEILNILKNAYVEARELKPEQVKTSKDIVTNIDLQIGKTVIDSLLAIKNKKILVVSEEYPNGLRNFKDGKEDYYIVVDDLDGTDNYYRGFRFNLTAATSIVVFHKTNHNKSYRFKDIICAACVDYGANKVWYTEKGMNKLKLYQIVDGPLTFKEAFKNGCKSPADMYSKKVQDEVDHMQKDEVSLVEMEIPKVEETKNKVVLTDIYSIDIGILADLKEEFWMKDYGSSVIQYCLVAAKLFDGYVSDNKKSHEIGILYLMCKENGQDMRDFDNRVYDNRVFKFNEHYNFIAGDKKVVKQIYNLIK